MTNLPTYEEANEAESFAFARAEYDFWRNNKVPFLGMDLNWFDVASNRRLAIDCIKFCALADPTGIQMTCIVEDAIEGWDLADIALCELIAQFENERREKPPPLGHYTMRMAHGLNRHRAGKKRSDYFLRDIVVANTVLKVRDKFGIAATGSSKRQSSACKIVAEAFCFRSEDTVVTIFKAVKKRARL